MNCDRHIHISVGSSRKATSWPGQDLLWSEFTAKLSKPIRTDERLAEYKSWPKSKQDELKDVGGFVGGTLSGSRRKNEFVTGRDLVTLDADTVREGDTTRILQAVAGLGCAYAVYSTRKHEAAAPRLRIIVPLDRTVLTDEYEPIARKVASYLGMEIFDPTTFEPVRLMYWPSCSKDSEYVFAFEDKPFVSADGLLQMYRDWRDVSEWPEVPGAAKLRERSQKRQGDPIDKKGVVGAFCRLYSITQAMEAFLPGVYVPSSDPGRYTFTGGSTVGGAVIYDDDKFLFSHHATDPCSGKLVNAFDLVRTHLFGEDDADASPETPTNRLPSYVRMAEYAVSIPEINQAIQEERYRKAAEAFSQQLPETPENVGQDTHEDMSWLRTLQINPETGKPVSTIRNTQIVLGNDPAIRDKVYYDEFSDKVQVCDILPWDPDTFVLQGERQWQDADDACLRGYLEAAYGITGKERIYDAFEANLQKNRKNKLKTYLQSLVWDGVPRVDTLLIDYFGAEDNIYTREATRKCLAAAVARVLHPGVKFDYMLILSGKQGIGKSTFFRLLGLEWYSDSLSTFEGKDAAELLQGYWIIEAGELTGLNRGEMNEVKQFLSKQSDIYRAAYGRRTVRHPRKCIIVGSTNDKEFLKDVTGNRRFWPIDLGEDGTKSVFEQMPKELNQIWAEAVFLLTVKHEKLILSKEAEKLARGSQEQHREISPKEGIVREFLEREVPADWYDRTAEARRELLAFGMPKGLPMMKRDKICALEIYMECFRNVNAGNMKRQDAAEINGILKSLEGWEPTSTARFGKGYGTQRGYVRSVNNVNKVDEKQRELEGKNKNL